jgi:hypothetical protein
MQPVTPCEQVIRRTPCRAGAAQFSRRPWFWSIARCVQRAHSAQLRFALGVQLEIDFASSLKVRMLDFKGREASQ